MSTLAPLHLRPPGCGRLLPPWLDTQHPEAQRGSTRVRSLDRNLLVGWNRRREVFQVWGPSLSAGGWVPLCDCQDDHGRHFRGRVPWEIIVAALVRARSGELSSDLAARANREQDRRRDRELDCRVEEGARFYARAVAGEREGWGRWDGREVGEAYRMAYEGRSKAAPNGVKYFVAR